MCMGVYGCEHILPLTTLELEAENEPQKNFDHRLHHGRSKR